MTNRMVLSPRLSAVASMLPGDCGICDVGTDHGYIPVYLALKGTHCRIVASDLREGPLANARQTGKEWGVSDRIEYILSDGLRAVNKDGIGCVICAGMGGETVESILRDTTWALDGSVSLVLQLQSKVERPLMLLKEKGYGVSCVTLAKDAGRFYTVFRAEKGINGIVAEPTETGLCRALLKTGDENIPAYLDTLIRKTEAALSGQRRAYSECAGVKKTERMLEELRLLRGESAHDHGQ